MSTKSWVRSFVGIAGFAILGSGWAEAKTPQLRRIDAAAAVVGTPVTFAVEPSDSEGEQLNLRYRFRVRAQGGNFQVIRDYGPLTTLDWTASKREGLYEMEVSLRNVETGEESSATLVVDFRTALVDGSAIVSPTVNSLVFLYSAPRCASGGRMRAEFSGADGVTQNTPYQNCNGKSMNFYLAGMRASSNYKAWHRLDTGTSFQLSGAQDFTTGELPGDLYQQQVVMPRASTLVDPLLLGSPLGLRPLAHDLAGNVVWYGPSEISILTRIGTGGEMWGVVEDGSGDPSRELVRKFDLTGMTLLETNAGRVNEQLRAMGKREITTFHHEARTLPEGRIAVLASVEQILTDVQGPGPVDVVGDMIVVMDKDLNVIWAWDAFDHLDVHRMAVSGEKCPSACPPLRLAATGTDWTHGNSIQQTPDGNLLYSSRHQDWLVKIAYQYGSGDGHVLWRMGKDGDFNIDSTDPYPWFSHQHDGNFEMADPSRLMVFDNGNTRVAAMKGGHSRGQVFEVDEINRTARPILNVDLGVYSAAVGSADRLRNGNYHFDAGFVQTVRGFDAYSLEFDQAGKVVYNSKADNILYRSFRISDMYTPN